MQHGEDATMLPQPSSKQAASRARYSMFAWAADRHRVWCLDICTHISVYVEQVLGTLGAVRSIAVIDRRRVCGRARVVGQSGQNAWTQTRLCLHRQFHILHVAQGRLVCWVSRPLGGLCLDVAGERGSEA